MKKTLVPAVLACVMTIFGFAASLQAQDSDLVKSSTVKSITFSANSLKILNEIKDGTYEVKLKVNLAKLPEVENKTFGYLLDGKFAPLSDVASVISSKSLDFDFGYATIVSNDGTYEFKNFEKSKKVPFKVSADPGYYAGYNDQSFYNLDFSSDPFNGVIDIVIGEPLPAPAVTLIVALAAGALFLLYKNRRQRSIQSEQA